MADRRDWGGGGDDPEESTQRMIERIWESLTDIQSRMDQQAPIPPVAVPPGDGETVPIVPVPPPPGVEELLVAGEQEIAHTKPFFFPFSSATTCINRPLEVNQRRRPCERDGPIGRVLRSCRDSKLVVF
ncbi:hypothetical protein Taro_010886 [Colocasia esculenta]|uniref:Uncharacterized protein n=1 Tax=Colocasia esculenta TaxID=4460 RepID=A0A843U8R7_COLES|nr:hypothetical protein [Colocasia esculenta]